MARSHLKKNALIQRQEHVRPANTVQNCDFLAHGKHRLGQYAIFNEEKKQPQPENEHLGSTIQMKAQTVIQRALYSFEDVYSGQKRRTIAMGTARQREADPVSHRDIGSNLDQMLKGEILFIAAHGNRSKVAQKSPHRMASHLIRKGLPEHVTKIHLYACGADNESKSYAAALQSVFEKKYKRKITVTGSPTSLKVNEAGEALEVRGGVDREEYSEKHASLKKEEEEKQTRNTFYLGSQGEKKKQETSKTFYKKRLELDEEFLQAPNAPEMEPGARQNLRRHLGMPEDPTLNPDMVAVLKDPDQRERHRILYQAPLIIDHYGLDKRKYNYHKLSVMPTEEMRQNFKKMIEEAAESQ